MTPYTAEGTFKKLEIYIIIALLEYVTLWQGLYFHCGTMYVVGLIHVYHIKDQHSCNSSWKNYK